MQNPSFAKHDRGFITGVTEINLSSTSHFFFTHNTTQKIWIEYGLFFDQQQQ